jgi:hypothetical protein
MSVISDEQTLIGATTEYGTPIKVYDDGFGLLWVYRESLGITGIVRAMSYEAAWDCVLDEILTPITEEDIIEAYGFYTLPSDLFNRTDSKYWTALRDTDERNGVKLAKFKTEKEAIEYCKFIMAEEESELIEGYKYQPNATDSGIVSIDLNGNYLDKLTPELVEELGIQLSIEDL